MSTAAGQGRVTRQELVQGALLVAFTLAIMAGLVLAGANDALLATASATVEIALALALVLTDAKKSALDWRRLAIPASLFLLALIAASAPLMEPASARGGLLATPDDIILEELKLVGGAAAMLAGIAMGGQMRRRPIFSLWMTGLGGLYMLLSLALWRLDPFSVGGLAKDAHRWRFTGTVFDANVAGCVFGMFALVAMGLLRATLERPENLLSRPGQLSVAGVAALTSILGMAACAFTGSRASFAGLVILSLFVALWRNRPRPATLVLVGAALVGAALGGATTLVRYQYLAHDLPSRLEIWRITLHAALTHPWFGIGLGGFNQMKAAALTPSNAVALWSLGSAHQALLQAAAEGGAPFIGLIVTALIWTAAPLRDLITAPPPVQGVALGTAAAAALAIGCSMFDIELNVPAVAALTLFLVGASAGFATEHGRRAIKRRARRRAPRLEAA